MMSGSCHDRLVDDLALVGSGKAELPDKFAELSAAHARRK
jgi:hypothetical protein